MTSIGKKVSELRKLKGLSQEDLAELAQINVRTIQRIENNKNTPRGNTLILISKSLDIDSNELINLNHNSTKNSKIETIINLIFLIPLNFLLISITGYLTLDSNANLNSRLAAYMLSVLIPLFIVLIKTNMKPTERTLKFGFGYFSYLILAIIIVGIPISFTSGLLPNLIISLVVLHYGNSIKQILKL